MEVDVAVVGGGPAGAAAALTCRGQGADAVIVEPVLSRPFRVGEALPPQARVALDALGVLVDFRADGHLESLGTASAWGSPELGYRDFLFERFGHGWHLDRARFDAALRVAATARGAQTLEAACVEVGHGNRRRFRLTCEPAGSASARWHVEADLIVDASGRRAVVGCLQGARRHAVDNLVGVAAVFGRGVASPARGHTLVEAVEHGWWYAAPVPGGRVLAALLADGDVVRACRWTDPSAWEAARRATRHVEGWLGLGVWNSALHVYSARSQVLEPAGGEGWAAAGDAACAMDPLSSVGILDALRSGVDAAEALLSTATGDGGGPAAYDLRVRQRFAAYLHQRRRYYSDEARWDTPFWARRHQRVAFDTAPAYQPR